MTEVFYLVCQFLSKMGSANTSMSSKKKKKNLTTLHTFPIPKALPTKEVDTMAVQFSFGSHTAMVPKRD